MTRKVDIENASVSVLLTMQNQMYLVAMKKKHYDAIGLLVKSSSMHVIPTNKSYEEFLNFTGYEREESE